MGFDFHKEENKNIKGLSVNTVQHEININTSKKYFLTVKYVL